MTELNGSSHLLHIERGETIIELRPYQKEAIEQIYRQHRVLLGDEQGLGKTRTTLEGLVKLAGDEAQFLIFCPRVALGTWKSEGKKWFGFNSLIYTGETKPKDRLLLWEQFQDERPELLIATFAMMDELLTKRRNWTGIAADEYHKVGLMNRNSATFKKFKKFHTRFLVLLTGTPVRKGPQDLFAPLHLISSHRFSSYWEFVNKYCVRIPDAFGYTIEPKPKNPAQFKELIAPYVIRRTKKKVLKELPPLQRQPVLLDMTSKQKQYYDELSETGILQTPEGVIACPNEAVKILRLRQLLTTPQIFGLPEKGAALESLLELVEECFDIDEPVAICTAFRPTLDFIEEDLSTLTNRIYKIHGGMKKPARDVADAFQNDKSTKKAIIFTITSGMSFDAYAASKGFVVGPEWSAIDLKQAEARMHRLGQLNHVNMRYLLHPGTIEDGVIDRLDDNTMAANWTLNIDDMLELSKHLRRDVKN